MNRKINHPFIAMVQKDITDHLRSWRYLILIGLMALTCIGSLYTATMSIKDAASAEGAQTYLFLKLFTETDGTLPPFINFVSFLGPLLGIALGFDAVNSERNQGNLSRILSQPIPRDYVINAKFLSGLCVISVLFFALGFFVMGLGMLIFGIPLTPEEFLRIFFFLVMTVFYVAFWLNLSILFSVRFRQPATSALSGMAIWLFFSMFYNMIVKIIVRATLPNQITSIAELQGAQQFLQFLQRCSPSFLFNEATGTLLTPSVRSLGFLSRDQLYGAIPNSPLPLGQSLLLVWPQITILTAGTMICFAISYVLFMRQEIRG